MTNIAALATIPSTFFGATSRLLGCFRHGADRPLYRDGSLAFLQYIIW